MRRKVVSFCFFFLLIRSRCLLDVLDVFVESIADSLMTFSFHIPLPFFGFELEAHLGNFRIIFFFQSLIYLEV